MIDEGPLCCGHSRKASEKERGVFDGVESEDVQDDEGVGGEGGAFPAPLFEAEHGNALLLQGGFGEGDFVVLGLARDEVTHLQQRLIGDH